MNSVQPHMIAKRSGWIMPGIILGIFCIIGSHSNVWAESLKATMGEVLLRNLQPGTTYHLTPMLDTPLKVTYSGNRPITLRVQPSLPEPTEMKPGFIPVPSLDWITTSPNVFELKGSSVTKSNISISIPEDETIRGNKYIIYIWSQTYGKGRGLNLGLGAKSRLLFTIASEASLIKQDTPLRSYLRFRIVPPQVEIKGVKPGKKMNVHRMVKQKFYIENTGDQDMTFELKSIHGSTLGMQPPSGYDWGLKDSPIKISPEKMFVKAGHKKKFSVSLRVPNRHNAYGKKLQYIIRANPEGVGMTSGTLFRINVETNQ